MLDKKDTDKSLFSSSLCPIKYKDSCLMEFQAWSNLSLGSLKGDITALLDELAIHFGFLCALYLPIKEKNHQFIFSFFCPDDHCHSSDIEGWRIFH